MPITGSDPALTASRLGILRIGAGRLGWPVLAGVRVPLYALLGVARLGATRLNYHSPKAFISIDGVQYGYARAVDSQKMKDSLSISDTLGATPNTAQCRVFGFIPTLGQDVVITLGSTNNLTREFGGQILSSTLGYLADKPANYYHDLNLIDYTWGLSKRKVTKRYTSTTVAAIAADLIATYATGYTVTIADDIGAESIDVITFTDQDLPVALTNLAKRVGGDWVCDYHKVVRLFYEDTVANPTILNAVNRLFSGFFVSRDLSQWITRVYFEGGGTNATADCVPGDTIIPVENGAWYPVPSISADGLYTVTWGWVTAGPQRVTYTAVDLGGGGGLVGPGAAPTSAPVLAAAGGTGITNGAHNVAVTFVTAAGESLPGPLATFTAATVTAPVNAPTGGTPTIGTGPNPGAHDYAVTFVSATGETTPGPLTANFATTTTNPPSSAPTPGTPTVGGSVDPGSHDYAVSYVTSIGETTPSAISGSVTTTADVGGDPGLSNPSDSPYPTYVGFPNGSGWTGDTGLIEYAHTLVNVYGETVPGPRSTYYNNGPNYDYVEAVPVGPSGTTARKLYRTTVAGGTGSTLKLVTTISGNSGIATYVDTTPDASLGAAAPSSNTTAGGGTTGNRTVPLTGIPTGDANVTSRKLYRRSGGAGLKLLATIGNNSTTTYSDTTANASLGAAVLSTSTAYIQRFPLGLPASPSPLVTHVKIYGTAVGFSQLKYIATVTNGTTSYTVTTTDAGLGANVPTSNTATANQIAVSSIQIGAATVTSRKLYMTAVASAQLKLVTTIADNVTSTYTISTADGSLGANVPTSDASGLTQPSGQVLAGSTALPVAGTGAFLTSGGWAVIGNGQQVIRYGGTTASTLTGIPASGIGAIVASIGYNSTVTASPQLTGIPASGVGSILYPILKGDPVNLFVQVDNVSAQTALAAYIGGDGIQEDSQQDRRLSFTEATARAEAHLALHSSAEVSIRYRTRDINTRAGRTIAVNLGPPFNVVADFMIQSVTETFPQTSPPINPTFDVVASSSRFSFDDLLRLARRQGA